MQRPVLINAGSGYTECAKMNRKSNQLKRANRAYRRKTWAERKAKKRLQPKHKLKDIGIIEDDR
jgi:hypothetical protein